jgi:hypothetical protein
MSEDNAYALRQAQRDAQHAEDYRRWVDTLPEAERAQLRSLGIDRPDINYHGSNARFDRDLADSSLASAPSDIVEHIDGEKPSGVTTTEVCGDALASFCARMRGCSNPALVFDAVCYGTGILAMEGQSATELAARHGVTKQAFSKIAVEWCVKFGLPPSRAMKSKRSRVAYRERAKAVHERHKLTTKPAV